MSILLTAVIPVEQLEGRVKELDPTRYITSHYKAAREWADNTVCKV